MPYSPEHKVRTRARIVENARLLFNRRGFSDVTIDEVMAAAGLTRGGFYKHFATKDELYAEAIRSFRTTNPLAKHLATLEEPPSPRELARRLVTLYLSDEVAEDPDKHCPLHALPSDVARSGLAPRVAYTEAVERMSAAFRRALGSGAGSKRKAELLVSICVGSMVISRTTSDPSLARSLRTTARTEALAILDGPP